MNNLCFFNSVKFWGGGEKLHLENAITFKHKGYDVFIVCGPESELQQRANTEKLNTFALAVGNLSYLNPFKIFQLKKFYKKNNIDTVVFSTSQDMKMASVSAKLAGVKNIVYLRGLAVPIKASLLNRIFFKSFLTHIISNSEETKRSILKHLGKYIDSEKVKTIYHGINLSEINDSTIPMLKEIKEKGHGVILGNAGRLTLQKGQDNLVKIAKILKEKGVDFTLFIAGTGELNSKLQRMIKESDLQENVVLLGFVEDMERFMNSIDIFLLSSTWEGFGYVIVEAMIKSKPVIAFDITSNPEIIDANTTGYLVEYPNLEAFSEKTIQLVMDEDLRKQMGEAGVKRVYERFVLEDRVTEIEQYLLQE